VQNTQIITEDRIDEVACLLATAIRRLTIRETSGNRDILLDFNAHPSVHALTEIEPNGGVK